MMPSSTVATDGGSSSSSVGSPSTTHKTEGNYIDPFPPPPSPVRRPTWLSRLIFKVEDLIDAFSWVKFFYYLLAYSYFFFLMYLGWIVLPLAGHWDAPNQSDKVPIIYQDFSNYFGSFHGFAECNIQASDLYIPAKDVNHAYCSRRQDLLESMSHGGRIGFDAPYQPRDCHYRWYTVAEICMILERFDSIVFVGDSALETIYNGFNVLLRQDLASGALKTWDMDKNTLHTCRCDNQFTSQACTQFYVTNSGDVVRNSNNPQTSAYLCHRTPHAFLPLSNSPAPNDVLQKFKSLVPPVPQSNYKPVPIIHSLSPSTASAEAATKSLLEFLALADASKRKTPMLWIGPTAAGHVEIKNRKGNQEIWDFDKQTARVAMENDVEVLKMWNMTVQAGSWDGLRFGERVAIIQAMMVINWLGRLESS
ncbi:hypothetical protein, variant 2 [Exophiala xenobiotica]|uniref:Uncharacterized protein n=1 Tax=Exophiala xenobiotica TaxID=348802 RepID=A0A0D2ETW3_9EURO|nr:hypothetical protein, variant 1 [Exophiala xenobiotica]XP_013318758.1 hypothetical protein, variant 2 [Exophiala xenobiotica]XP_013318759.1 uncharacterized protein PV05_02720 [Exophiala xenobiotica]KIW58173.1 hypothetical protein PV05_02720 [Exophiala xenobiotica]KIW58174.1 hypothetical protein, variant 1 [Exophiala xenobiotica]KIW58175.1 hypothetical protein, variant 2 [Exophiala xenobiotica]